MANSRFLPFEGGTKYDCHAGHAVSIEPSLRPRSPENGSFSNVNRRLSASWLRERPKLEGRDWWPIRKSPAVAGLSATIRNLFSEGQTAWLTWEGSNSHIPKLKKPIEMSGEFSLVSRNSSLETFAATSCEF